ncbi:MAG: sensor histidine kinase [Sphingobacteriaceae bacterium]|nr:sensor histidine kinase [Sphingobacteriaceae bacterium]
MNKIYYYIYFIIFNLSLHFVTCAQITIKQSDQIINVNSGIWIFEDKFDTATIENISNFTFTSQTQQIPNFGFSSSQFWLKIIIKNTSKSERFLVEVSNPVLDEVQFYKKTDAKSPYQVITYGEAFPFYQRKFDDPNYLFECNIPKDSTRTYFIKIKGSEGIQVPLQIGEFSIIQSKISHRNFLSGIYCGIMLVMILYNLFVYFSVRDSNYIYYVIYIILVLLTQTNLQGYTLKYLWPNSHSLAKYSLFTLPSFVGIAALIFMNVFLKIKSFNKTLFNLTYLFLSIYLISLILAYIDKYELSQKIMELNAMVVSIYMLIVSILVVKSGYPPAKYFLFGWSIFLIGVIVFVLKDVGVLPFNNFTRYTMQIGSGIETILLSFALASKINIYKKESLEAVQEKEKLVREQNVLLEEKVTARTQELNNAIANLKQTQSQLVNAEKMASLGQLTAGIAHEINNPINFVSANIKPLKLDIKDVLELINKYELILKDLQQVNKQDIEAFKQKIDFEYVKSEIFTLLNGIEEGAKRTTEIVSGLRNFSRLDEIDIKTVNINEGIKSTLTLLNSSIPDNLKIITNYGNIPAIECFPGKLNQVFMNLIANSIFAVKKNTKNQTNFITINTSLTNDQVLFSIEDTGIGMSASTISKVFEPFFTTKDVGEGTGLGMSIVYSILKSHDAEINIRSFEGKGTTITILFHIKLNISE